MVLTVSMSLCKQDVVLTHGQHRALCGEVHFDNPRSVLYYFITLRGIKGAMQ